MIKNEPIIFQIYNDEEEQGKFVMPYNEDLLIKRPNGRKNIRVDIKVNAEWHTNIYPFEFEIYLAAKEGKTILIKPHNDKYFAGWGRWFTWDHRKTSVAFNWQKPKSRIGFLIKTAHARLKNKLLTAVLSDPDYAHLESETKIGDNFRRNQYFFCLNLTTAPHEDLDDEFEEVGDNFRTNQYIGCGSLKNKPIEVAPNVKKAGKGFRYKQYERTKFA